MMQQHSSHPPIAPACGSNGGFDNNVSLTSSSNSCFPHSSSSAGSGVNPWGTWEDLLLASAVLRHGMDNWTTVSCELQARAFLVPPSLFSAEACKVRFWILNGRFSSCNGGTIRDGKIPWFEEVRKLRVAQLKRELEHYDGSIGLLEKKLSRLRAENAGPTAVVSRNAHEQNKLSSLAPQEAVTCVQVYSAGDQIPAEQSLGTSSRLDSESGNCSCAVGGVEVQEATLVSALKESLNIKSSNQNLASTGLVFDSGSILDQSETNSDHEMHADSILDRNPLVCRHLDNVNESSAIDLVDHKPHASQDCPCSIAVDKRSSVKIEEAERSSVADGAMSLDMESQSCESEGMVIGPQDDCASILVKERAVDEGGIKELEDGGPALEDTCCLGRPPPGLDRSGHNDVACTVEGLGVRVEYSHGPPGLNHPGDDSGCAKSESVNVPPSAATNLAHNIVKEDYLVGDSLVSASAMDLLRIAYAEGTPVSTPEETEIQPIELKELEDLECSEMSDCVCPIGIQELASCEPDLLCCDMVEAPGQGVSGELQMTKQNQTLGTQMILDKALKVLDGTTPLQIEPLKPTLSSEPEHLRGQKGCEVAGMDEVRLCLSSVPIVSNLGAETIVIKADTGQPLNGGGYSVSPVRSPSLISKPSREFLNSEKEDTPPANTPLEGNMLHETQEVRKGARSTNSNCRERFQKECNDNAKVEPCLEIGEFKSGECSGAVLTGDLVEKAKSKTLSTDENFPAKMENLAVSPSKSGSHRELPAVSFCALQEVSQVSTGGVQPIVVLKKELLGTAMHCECGAVELGQAESHGCDPNLVPGSVPISNQISNNLSCHSDGKNSVMEPVFESLSKQEEPKPDYAIPDRQLCAGKGTLKINNATVERIFSEAKPDSKASNKQAKLEERSKHLARCKSSRDVVSSSLLFKGKHKAEIDALEEDGLLVDLMKLKETDLTTLRKRKHVSGAGNNVEKREDYGLSKDGLGGFVVSKHPKLSKCQEEDGNRTILSATQNKNPSKLKSNSGDGLGHAANSSTVSSLDSLMDFKSKESAVDVFSTRRSRLKLRKPELQREEPDKTKRGNLGSVQNFETVLLKAADEAPREIESSPIVDNVETSAYNNGLLPDLLILLECLRTISGHRFAPFFKVRPEIQSDVRYRCLVKRHMDLNTVRTKLEEGRYSESLEFFRDMMLIFSNALVFYSRDSQEYGAACVLRESLMREMDIFFGDEYRTITATQAVKYSNEPKVFKNMNIGCSVPTCDVKKQASVKSSCDCPVSEIGLHCDHGTGEATLGTTIATKDFGSGKSTRVKELDCKKKERDDLLSSKALSKTKLGRTRARGGEDREVDRLNLDLDRSGRERPSRSLENAVPSSSTSVVSSQVLRKSHQASTRNSREVTPRKDPFDRSRSSKYSFERPGSLLQGRQEPKESLRGSGRSSRSAQQSKQTHSRGSQSYQPQKRART